MAEEFDPKVLIEHIDSFGHGLSEWEVGFIASMNRKHRLLVAGQAVRPLSGLLWA